MTSPIKRVGVAGSGIMGSGIAEVAAKAGYDVVLRSRAQHSADAMMAGLEKSLAKQVERHRFRADLFYRLTGVEINLPPLRDRPSDIRPLVAHFLERSGAPDRSLTSEAMHAFLCYHWPGNIRELERIVQRCLAWSNDTEIGIDALPLHLSHPTHLPHPSHLPHPMSLKSWTAFHVQAVYQNCGQSKSATCRLLAINPRTLQRHLTRAANLMSGPSRAA